VRASPQRDLANPTPFLLVVIGPFVLCHSVLSLASITRFTGVVGRSNSLLWDCQFVLTPQRSTLGIRGRKAISLAAEPGQALETFLLPNTPDSADPEGNRPHHEYTHVSRFRSRVSRQCCANVGHDTHLHHRRRPIHPSNRPLYLCH
jgi:hypothetical protein